MGTKRLRSLTPPSKTSALKAQSLPSKKLLVLRPIYVTFLVGYLLVALNSYTYFLWLPVITELLISLCLALAIAASKTASISVPGPKSLALAADVA